MTIQTPTNEPTQATSDPKDLGELSFTDYQKVRRGEAVADSVQTKSALAPAKAAEQKKSENSDPSEPASDDESESDDASEGEGDKPESKEASGDKPKKSGWQRRIDKLNARNTAAQQEAEFWKAEALKKATAPKDDSKDPAKPAKTEHGKPDPDKFDTHSEYVEALTDWKYEQREKAAKEEAAKAKFQTEQDKVMQSHASRVKSFMEKTADFQEVIEGVEHIPYSPAFAEVVTNSELGPELMYEAAKNPAEFERIQKLSPLAAAREMGKLEAKISATLSNASDTEKKPESKKTTSAPKPIEPVGSGKGHVAKSLDDPNLSFSDYERLRRDQMKRKRG